MTFDPTIDVVSPESIGIIDLDVRRQNKALHAKIEQLQAALDEREKMLVPAIGDRDTKEHEQCSFHLHITIDDRTGIVECRTCGTRLEPGLVLLQFARKERNFVFSINHLRQEQLALRVEVDGLRKERSRLRSDIKRRKRSAGSDSDV